MRLSKLKLTGFKSFVDHTTLSFPSNRVGVVGPNGCGKSNVIDAVRWVMGESSAKQLRGSAMSDVIFNGSRTRKPIDQASIELVFEEVNVPQYPEHSEIAVKRQLSRNGQSTYFLNSVRCRRKDITDIFLGTGLGPRSYAIIEQGMISRLIEAKPDELRVFMEEAAGISKYKERRKETELRMNHTRENMARLDDVRNELGKQLDKLKKQAKQAEKFQELKKSEELLRAQLQAIRWYALDSAVQEQQQYIEEQGGLLEKDVLALQNFDSTHKQQREAQTIAQNTLNEAQAKFYGIESEIGRLEQSLQHANERCEQLQGDLAQLDDTQAERRENLGADEQQVANLDSDIQENETALATALEAEKLAVQALHEAEDQLRDLQYAWDEFNQRSAEPTQRAQVERTRMQNLEQQLDQNKLRLVRLDEEGKDIDIKALERMVVELEKEIAQVQTTLDEAEATLKTHYEAVLKLRDVTQEQSAQLQAHQSDVHKLSGRLASLETLQEAALGQNDAEKEAWLQAQGLHDAPRLAASLQVESGWERAVEIVLGARLQALCVADMAALEQALEKPPQGVLAVFDTGKRKSKEIAENGSLSKKGAKLLLDKVQAPWPLTTLLTGVWSVETLSEAYRLRTELAAHESIMTSMGIWLGPNWLDSQQGMDENAGVLARKQEIDDITAQLGVLEQTVQSLSQSLEEKRIALHEGENSREQAQLQVNEIRQQLSQLQSQHSGKQARLEHIKAQLERIANERAELTTQIQNDNEALTATRDKLHAALEEMGQLADEREELARQRDLSQETVAQTSQTWQTAKDERHKVEVRVESLRTDHARLLQSIARLQSQLEKLAEQRSELQHNLDKQTKPIERWQTELTEQQHKRTEAEEGVIQAKQTVEHLEAALNDYEGERQRLETHCNELRTAIEKARMTCQGNEVRRQTLEEQLAETDFSPVALVGDLPEYADEESWQAQIEAVERKLERLGSVNMAALEEFEEQNERKQYLDNQTDDLNKALISLENAIKTIDKETRIRFKQTLDQVNNFLQTMFPRLFGGGEASLQLVGDDILKAGVAIMARPPGKRNTHIHLLSGGEKALTAIALVFAIFELNPAPFCMLDEVDAPLDDSNVGRFCTLVKAMSERVQFIFISHNKITMEIADQLIGVTMQEAGVSRLVAVDIDMAVDMVKT
ncbi:MAG: chromosome segregation protein SMC [Candidatus Parabeggiatoa sp. nov. 3]|nr:MAG: chromosome segregation protein SMC [Gammaproteobacteria bacterium]RKZ79192.1 MAG: chromosome segregation protein SMC [Gammaproteobacteria bacterium]